VRTATHNAGEVDPAALDHLLSMSSVEIFPVLLPTKATDFFGVSVYCDDKGVAKELEENTRVSGIVQQCGFPGQTFRGDCFISRVFDDNEEFFCTISVILGHPEQIRVSIRAGERSSLSASSTRCAVALVPP